MNPETPRPNKLLQLRENLNLTLKYVALKTGIAQSTLSALEHDDEKDFSVYALKQLAAFYNVSADYLIGLTENKTENHTPINRLRLSDDAVQVLKSGKINPRLLSEMIAHPGFRRLMVDAEIYVDRIAEASIQSLNTYLESSRQAVMKEADADPEDLYMRSLEAGQVEEDEYFGHVLHDDLMTILKTIRENHKADPMTADSPVAEDMAKAIEEAKSLEGTPQEKAINALFRQLQIFPEKFTTEERAIFIKIFESSPLLKQMQRQNMRGKNPKSHGPRKGRGKNKKRLE